MRIGIDYRLAAMSNRGMARYCREITDSLLKNNHNHNFILFVNRNAKILPDKNLPYDIVKLPIANFILGEQIFLPITAKKKCDILWSPYNTFPLFLSKKVKLAVTIHDLIFFYKNMLPENFYQKIGRIYRKICISYAYKRINFCFTVSNYSKKEIQTFLHINNVIITNNCIGKNFINSTIINNYHSAESSYFFTISGDAPSKNLLFLLKIFNRYLYKERLIIAGVSATSKMREFESKNIHFLPMNITDIELMFYLKNSTGFIFPSLYEGFGIPIIEALYCGVKILASNTTSIPEVIGKFGLLFDPEDEQSFLVAFNQLPTFSISKIALEEHLKKYMDWNLTAKKIIEVIT